MMRLNKYVAHAGICSRRKAADLVKAGEVSVNGEVEKNPAYEVQDKDVISYQGKEIKLEQNKVYLLLNKPKNYVTTLSDERDRKTVMDLVRNKVKERIYPVGRLDRMTTGLLLLTNDGDLAKKLTHPSHGVKKIYQVLLDRDVDQIDIEKIRDGFELEDGEVEVDNISYVKGEGKNTIGVEIHMGKNRIVRRIFEHFDYRVIKLDRVYFGGLTKKDLPRGFTRPLSEQEIVMLKHFS
jgi:23S rRNA pseudouridine2605 synthase